MLFDLNSAFSGLYYILCFLSISSFPNIPLFLVFLSHFGLGISLVYSLELIIIIFFAKLFEIFYF